MTLTEVKPIIQVEQELGVWHVWQLVILQATQFPEKAVNPPAHTWQALLTQRLQFGKVQFCGQVPLTGAPN